MPIHFELVTPERVLYKQEVDEVTLPTEDGEITVLPGHAQLVATLVAGVGRIKTGATHEEIAVSGGCVQVVDAHTVRVFADTAERAAELNISVIEQAKARAEQVMKELVHADDASYAMAAAVLERELARYRVAMKHTGRKHVPTLDAPNLPHDENPS